MGWTAPVTASTCQDEVVGEDLIERSRPWRKLARSVWTWRRAIDAAGRVVVRRQLRRGEVLGFFARLRPCLVACATAHHWGRELIMSPAYVKPYVKRGKTDAADAEAIAEAVTRPTMRFVAVKSMDQQAVLMLHKVRDLLVRQRTMLINALRATWPSSGS